MNALSKIIATLACIIVLDCLTGFTSPLNDWLPDPGNATIETKFVMGLISFSFLMIGTLMLITKFIGRMLSSTGRLGHNIGMMMIRAMTASKHKSWLRDTIVRWLWAHAGRGRKLKSVRVIGQRARGILPAAKTLRIEHHKPEVEEDEPEADERPEVRESDNVVPMKRRRAA